MVGSITDCINNKLEVKYYFDKNVDDKSDKSSDLSDLKKGNSVSITGVMEQFANGPPVLRVDRKSDVRKVKQDRVSFIEILQGFKTAECKKV